MGNSICGTLQELFLGFPPGIPSENSAMNALHFFIWRFLKEFDQKVPLKRIPRIRFDIFSEDFEKELLKEKNF